MALTNIHFCVNEDGEGLMILRSGGRSAVYWPGECRLLEGRGEED